MGGRSRHRQTSLWAGGNFLGFGVAAINPDACWGPQLRRWSVQAETRRPSANLVTEEMEDSASKVGGPGVDRSLHLYLYKYLANGHSVLTVLC